MKKLRLSIAVALVIAAAVVAYFLFFRQTSETAPPQKSTAEQKPLYIPSAPATAEKAFGASEQPAAQATSAAETPVENQTAQAASQTAGAESEGRFTLQLASMPDEKAANEMAARLKANGLPAYVVSADLGSRGVWFRVRVGRFETAEEAKSFAQKSRLEARVEQNEN